MMNVTENVETSNVVYLGSSLNVFNVDLSIKNEYADLCKNYDELMDMVENSEPCDYNEIVKLLDENDCEVYDGENHEIYNFGNYLVIHDIWNGAFYFFMIKQSS